MIVYLVRHAEVVPRAGIAPAHWPLSPAGEAAARTLATSPRWASLATLISSDEPKAIATARPIADATGLELRVDPALREVDRGELDLVSTAEYHALVAAHFAGQCWERDPAARITACIDLLRGPACVVSHGLVLAHYLARLLGREPDVAAWRGMAQPAVAVVDRDAKTLLAPFVALETFLAAP